MYRRAHTIPTIQNKKKKKNTKKSNHNLYYILHSCERRERIFYKAPLPYLLCLFVCFVNTRVLDFRLTHFELITYTASKFKNIDAKVSGHVITSDRIVRPLYAVLPPNRALTFSTGRGTRSQSLSYSDLIWKVTGQSPVRITARRITKWGRLLLCIVNDKRQLIIRSLTQIPIELA